jgi:hypothetical protein
VYWLNRIFCYNILYNSAYENSCILERWFAPTGKYYLYIDIPKSYILHLTTYPFTDSTIGHKQYLNDVAWPTVRYPWDLESADKTLLFKESPNCINYTVRVFQCVNALNQDALQHYSQGTISTPLHHTTLHLTNVLVWLNPLKPNDLQWRHAMSPIKTTIPSKIMREKPTNATIIHSVN